MLHPFASLLWQLHLPEDFARAKLVVEAHRAKVELADLLLVSGGASVGDKDFTRELLEFLNFEIVFHRLSLRPGAPLMFGVQGGRIAFGLPGNPLAHFVVWHVFIAPALARLTGATPPDFATGTLSSPLTEADCPRETLWPARCQIKKGTVELTPLSWGSSGDVSCLATANALIRVPAGTNELPAGARVEFLPITF